MYNFFLRYFGQMVFDLEMRYDSYVQSEPHKTKVFWFVDDLLSLIRHALESFLSRL